MANGTAIPQKIYFRIGEVARIVGVPAHVIRFWETEFRVLRPQKSRSGQRIYARRDVERLVTIKKLLREQRYTIEGARKYLRERGMEPLPPSEEDRQRARTDALRGGLLAARARLLEALAVLSPPAVTEPSDTPNPAEQ